MNSAPGSPSPLTDDAQVNTNDRKQNKISQNSNSISLSPFLMASQGKGMLWRGSGNGDSAQELRRRRSARKEEWRKYHEENLEKVRWKMWGDAGKQGVEELGELIDDLW